jgi:hypothetical protein
MQINASNRNLELATNTVTRLTAASNGDISFYEDTGTTPKFVWDASAESLGIGVTDPIYSLEVQGQAGIELYNGTGGGSVLNFRPSLGDANKYNMSISSYDHSGGGVGPADGISINAFDGVSISTGSQTARQERLRIDSSGRAGIGTSIPSTFNSSNAAGKLVVGSGSGNEGITVYSGTTSTGTLCFADGTTSTDTYKGYVQYNHNTNSMQFATGHTERMRLDASGNLLVGKTASNTATVGIELRASNLLNVTSSGAQALQLNRLSSDGDIAKFLKDGTTVGSIASTFGTDIHVGTGDTRLRFVDDNDYIRPANSDGSSRNGLTDLGASTARFKDLYLSGGVVFGTTGGAVTSKTLDDYEEGTWSITVTDGTNNATLNASYNTGVYTKIGRLVTLTGRFIMSSKGSLSGQISIGGIPFNGIGGNNYNSGGFIAGKADGLNLTAGTSVGGEITSNSNLIKLTVWDIADGSAFMDATNLDATADMSFAITYMTAA